MIRVLVMLASFVLSLLACHPVQSIAPVGSRPVALDAEDWNGTWCGDDGDPVLFRVVDSANGVLRMSGIEIEEGEARWEHSYLYLRTVPGHEDWIFVSAEDDLREDEPPSYSWARVKRKGELLLVWFPDAAKFEALVEDGRLPGEIDDDRDVRLWELDDADLALIVGEESGALFEWDDPHILWRTARLDPM
jgi:hypothetical protein